MTKRILVWLYGFFWLMLYWTGGVCLAWAMPIGVPVAIWGLLIGLGHCLVRGRLPLGLREWADLDLVWLPALFVPAIIGLLDYQALLSVEGERILLVIALSTWATMIVPAWVYLRLRRRG